MINVDVNVSILFKEFPFIERFAQAARSGFEAVEFYWDKGHDPDAIASAVLDNGLRVASFNFDAGELQSGDRGLLNDSERYTRMRENVPVAIELAQKVGCKRLTALAGNLRDFEDRESQIERIRENLRWICDEARPAGITIMVEAINAFDNPLYPFTGTKPTLEFLDSVGAGNLEYLYDIYHMQRMEGNIISTLREHTGRIGHIQIADSPERHHPGTGEINFRRVFQTIEAAGYKGSVGLEYLAVGQTEEALAWLPLEHRGGIHLDSFVT
ncbi:MAG: hydroxypyruvate isomerase family protein [Pyrinomonadaceae bacterium]